MKNRLFILLILLLPITLVDCASIEQGELATPLQSGSLSPGLIVTGSENTELSSDYFGEVNLTFENQTANWMRIKQVSLDFENSVLNQAVQVPTGADLVAWAEAIQQRKDIHDYNSALVLGSVMLIGSGIAISRGHNPAAPVGALASIGAAGILAAHDIGNERIRLQTAGLVPDSHLLADGFVIPPGLHTMKWITFYTKEPQKIPYISHFVLSLLMEDGHTEKMRLDFRTGFASNWQHPLRRG